MYDELKFENCSHSKDPVLGCALEGVASVIAGINDVSIVIHSPQGCAATVANAFDNHEIDFTKRKIGCTRLFETDIIMGASEKLENLIREADKSFGRSVMFVVGTCAADIIGEDIEGLCKNLQPEINARLIPVVAGGFRGNVYDGINLGLKAITPFIKTSGGGAEDCVNLLIPQANINPTWMGDLDHIKNLLEQLDIRVQTVLPHNMGLEELGSFADAKANILLSGDAGQDFAKRMQEKQGIPLIMGDIPQPVGLKNTARWIRSVATYFDKEEKAEEIIRAGEEKVADILRRRALMIIPRYRNLRIAVCADATYGVALVRMLFEELEMIPELILIRSSNTRAAKILEREIESMGISPKVAFGVDGYQIKKALEESRVDAVLGSSWEKYMAEEAGIKIAFDLFAPTNRDIYLDKAYMGYEGMLNMLEIIGNDWERAFRSKEINWEQYA
ncbi:nitrogenase iron-iron protein beta chain [Ruminiclostridium hungatei]|uniref:Nitrogenase iron-iron protein beta chain n=1 Tax=Ruminiclostridium hungatei TaxID=48256 RepID=A0A1V4SJG7_RUMHU|nr:nitrogenase component 1 [Ruminiclostridium hungatei]OPX43391.1 nitrogenase iron-iron protein beta chain [Ruminiclostridium hungatei]